MHVIRIRTLVEGIKFIKIPPTKKERIVPISSDRIPYNTSNDR